MMPHQPPPKHVFRDLQSLGTGLADHWKGMNGAHRCPTVSELSRKLNLSEARSVGQTHCDKLGRLALVQVVRIDKLQHIRMLYSMDGVQARCVIIVDAELFPKDLQGALTLEAHASATPTLLFTTTPRKELLRSGAWTKAFNHFCDPHTFTLIA